MAWLDSTNGWLSQQLGASTGLAGFPLLFLAGALASLLPCVYPLYPVTAAVLSHRGQRFVHPFTYYAGLTAVYFGFGIIASLTGGSFNEVLRLPATNLVIGGLLVMLALATAGLLHFPMWTGSGSVGGSGLGGTFAMGAGAGLLSSACVGPVVVSILVSIAAGTTEVSAATALLAATKMMLFGMGVGLPLLLIGVFGMALPKGGVWMVRVQQGFGILIAWFAMGYVFKGLSGAGFSEGTSWSLLAGVGLVAGAVFYAQAHENSIAERTKRTMLTVVGVVGFFVIGRSILGSTLATAAVGPSITQANPATETHGNLTWYLDKNAAYAVAARTGQPVFADFHGDWCTNCEAFQKQTLADKRLNDALARSVLLKVRDTTALFEEYRRDPRFPELKVGLPFFIITDAKEQLLYKTSDYTNSKEMALFLPEAEP